MPQAELVWFAGETGATGNVVDVGGWYVVNTPSSGETDIGVTNALDERQQEKMRFRNTNLMKTTE